jgi:hypothetical protein
MSTTNPTDLNLSFTPPAIQGFDYAALEAWALAIAEKYRGLVVTEDQVVGIKSEMAHLNATKKKLDDVRKEAVKVVSAPIKEFEAQIKAVCAIFDNTYAALSEQVKNHEERAREIKRQEVLFAIETLTTEAGFPGLEIPVQDSWLNKTQKPKQTAADIQAFILRHDQALKAAAAAEQAKQDRAVAIENQNAALAQGYGFTIPLSQFYALHNLETPLEQVNEAMTSAYRAKAEANAKATAPVAPAPAKDVFGRAPLASGNMMAMQDESPVQASLAAPTARKGLTIHIEFDAAREVAIHEALRHLQALCTEFAHHAKPLADAYPLASPAPASPRVRSY